MTHQLTDISTVRKRLDVEIPQEVVDEEINRIARDMGRRARVPGFRPGRAPLGVVKNRYRDDILSETCQQLLPRYFGDATREEGLDVVDAPEYDDIDHGRDRPLRFSATFEVFPVLDITNHTGIPVEGVPTEVTDAEVDAAIERLIEEHSEMVPVEEDRPAADGDFAEITFTGALLDDDSPDNEFKAERALCEIGGKTTIDEFTEHLSGARPGEDRTFDVGYREDHPDERLAGKRARYTVHVESLKTRQRPSPDDEFARSLGQHETIEELRRAIRGDLETHRHEHARERRRDALLAWLREHNQFEVPETLVSHQLGRRIERLLGDVYRQGVDPRGLNVDWSRIRQDQHEYAVQDVRSSLILSHLARREGIEASEEEVAAEIARMAGEMKQPPERVREALSRDNGLEHLEIQIRNDKVLGLLEERAQIVETDGPTSSDEPEAGAGAGPA